MSLLAMGSTHGTVLPSTVWRSVTRTIAHIEEGPLMSRSPCMSEEERYVALVTHLDRVARARLQE